MSQDAQTAAHTGGQIFLDGPHNSSISDRQLREHGWGHARVDSPSIPGELPAVRGESAVLQLRQRGANRASKSPASVLVEPVAEAVTPSKRILLTHVFTDIVASTETLERLGDRAWCSLLQHHHNLMRDLLKTYHGREVDASGDGFFLVFDRPSRAVQFAAAVRTALKRIGIDLRIGIHAGECEVVCGRVVGVAVHTAARIVNEAGAGDILVSSTVRDLVAGSEHRFSKKDVRVLKGLSEPRQLFALECSEGMA